jgi:hypothetical protein
MNYEKDDSIEFQSYFDDYMITDEYLLNYLLHKYRLDKEKLILSIKRNREKEFKLMIIRNFYEKNKEIINYPFPEHWKLFVKFVYCGPNIEKEELEDYYQKYIQ